MRKSRKNYTFSADTSGCIYKFGDIGNFNTGDKVCSLTGTILEVLSVENGEAFEGMDIKTGEISGIFSREKFGKLISVRKNYFRDIMTGELNRRFLRINAVRRLFSRGYINKHKAIEFLGPAMGAAIISTWN